MRRLSPTGCAWERISSVRWATPTHHHAIQRVVLAEQQQPGSRAFDLGDDAARFRVPKLRRVSARQKGPLREREAHKFKGHIRLETALELLP